MNYIAFVLTGKQVDGIIIIQNPPLILVPYLENFCHYSFTALLYANLLTYLRIHNNRDGLKSMNYSVNKILYIIIITNTITTKVNPLRRRYAELYSAKGDVLEIYTHVNLTWFGKYSLLKFREHFQPKKTGLKNSTSERGYSNQR